MNIVAQNHTFGEHLSSKVSCFLEEFHVGKILKACNAYKIRGNYSAATTHGIQDS